MSYQPSLFENEALKPIEWHPTRESGLERLSSFVPFAGRQYSADRNFDLGPDTRSNISCLSPWIKYRLLEETEVLQSVSKAHSFHAAEKFIQEVFWRGYFKGWLQHNPAVWHRFRNDVVCLSDDLIAYPNLAKRVDNATSGETGIACFDTWAKELKDTGYLHNHARMWFASIWIFTLKLPWQLGAQFFYRYLLDGDIASNTLSWRWVGGLHTKGKTYLARPSNIEKYTNGRFYPEGQLALEAPAFVEADLPSPVLLPEKLLGAFPNTPAPNTPAKTGLLVTSEDCRPETLGLLQSPMAVLGCSETGLFNELEQSPAVKTFKRNALKDALSRAERAYCCPTEEFYGDNWQKQTLEWARANQLDCIVTPYAAVGPLADQLKLLQIELADHGLPLVEIPRHYDQTVWPHAQKGFFKLKSKLPTILQTLELFRINAGSAD